MDIDEKEFNEATEERHRKCHNKAPALAAPTKYVASRACQRSICTSTPECTLQTLLSERNCHHLMGWIAMICMKVYHLWFVSIYVEGDNRDRTRLWPQYQDYGYSWRSSITCLKSTTTPSLCCVEETAVKKIPKFVVFPCNYAFVLDFWDLIFHKDRWLVPIVSFVYILATAQEWWVDEDARQTKNITGRRVGICVRTLLSSLDEE